MQQKGTERFVHACGEDGFSAAIENELGNEETNGYLHNLKKK